MVRNCPACFSANESLNIQGCIFCLHKCADCGLAFSSPMPSDNELLAYYQGFNFLRQSPASLLRSLPAIRESLQFFVGRSESHGRFLDYGGGSGIYTLAAEQLGWEADLFDYDKQMIDFARREMGVSRAYSTMHDVAGPYDVIFAFHVVEHWNNFDQSFRQLLGMLAERGSLVFATPNANSVEKCARPSHRKSYKDILLQNGASEDQAEFWMNQNDSITCWNPPRHLFAFTPKSFVEIGKRYALKTTIWTGYNTSQIFEPRSYIVPRYVDSMMGALGAVSRHPRSAFRRLLSEIALRHRLHVLQRSHPDMGEQLYVRFST